MSATYSEFFWRTTGPGNGESGVGLADRIVSLVGGLSSVQSICDLGCGSGYLADRLAERGYHVTGVDASETGIKIADRTYSKPVFVRERIDAGLGQRTGIKDIDLVIASDVIEHLYRPADLLEAARSLLRPAGEILITTPYHGYWKNLFLAVAGKMDKHFSALHDGGHIKFFSVQTLSALVAAQGFVDLKFSFYGRGPWLWKNMICQARKSDD